MTSISAANQYVPYQALNSTAARTTPAASSDTTTDKKTDTSGDTVEISDAAKQAAAGKKDFSEITDQARALLDKLLKKADVTSPLDDDGKLSIDLSKLNRRELYAVASNSNDGFTDDEQDAAKQEMQNRFDAALAGPLAVARVTGDVTGLYKAAQSYLADASKEEKQSTDWKDMKAAVDEALQDTIDDPDNLPDVDGDPVADYITRSNDGQTGDIRDFGSVATDARMALDAQYDDAKANHKELVFNSGRKIGQMVDFSDFDSRSLSAIALNEGNQFNSQEVFAAKEEMRTRSNNALLASFNAAGSDPTAFATNIISAYGSMSPEERTAAGWSDDFYSTVLQNYQSTSKIVSMFSNGNDNASGGGTGVMSLLNYL
ncbi:MAG TPA: hypothetical protein VGM83_19965 [Devosiaceae bacterium]|jgi:hypothetical protein